MHHPNRLLFILADGAHARFVQRNGHGAFVTVREIDGSRQLKKLRRELHVGPTPGRAQESSSPTRHGVGREDYARQVKEAFVAQVAQEAREFSEEPLVVFAPAKLIPAFRDRLGDKAAAVVAKDLTKTPDAELGRWLEPMFLQARQPVS